MVTFTLLPAVDVADGQAVRLVQGKAGTEKSYGAPLDAARAWVEQGATWIHLVDLDAAFGRGSNAAAIAKVVHDVRGQVHVELSGGIRDDASLAAALATGCSRVNLGTAALEDPDWTARVIAKDGTMHGPNLHLLKDVCKATDRPVIASGGIARLEDLHRLVEMVPLGIEGAIVGRALYDGAFTLAEAITAIEPRFDPYEWAPPQP